MTTLTTDRWVATFESRDGLTYIESLDGVSWADAPKPRRWHRCKPQTRGIVNLLRVNRCACGAISETGHYWLDRNSRG